MRILVYKRTHVGDPNEKGEFGCHDCMGKIRAHNYDAVIGIGVMRPWKGSDIAGKVTWVGVGPTKGAILPNKRGPIVTFDKFAILDENGPLAPPSLHPQGLPRHIILYEGKQGYKDAYHDAKSIIGLLLSGNSAHISKKMTINESPPKNCRGGCNK